MQHVRSAAFWAPLATVVLWAGNTVVTKAAFGLISPGSISLYRWVLAFLLLLPLAGRGAWGTRRVAARHWWQMAIQAGLGMVLYQSLAYTAARTTTAVNMGVIVALMPLMSILLAGLIAGEKLTARKIGGGVISLAGLVYLTSRGNPASLLQDGIHPGDAHDAARHLRQLALWRDAEALAGARAALAPDSCGRWAAPS